MTKFSHAISVWPSECLVSSSVAAVFNETLPADLQQLQTWVDAAPTNLLTAIVAKPTWDFGLIAALSGLSRFCFVIVWHPSATEDPMSRIKAFQAGARMVTNDADHLVQALHLTTSVLGTGQLECPWCGLTGLSTLELWRHQPLYHIYELDLQGAQCPACRKQTSRLTRHINLYHGPTPLVDERTGVFALAIIRRPTDGKFLLVQERYGEGYWVPGGGVDHGESLRQGVMREAREEAGAEIVVTGILTIEALRRGEWRRIIFLAEPVEAPSDGGGGAAHEAPIILGSFRGGLAGPQRPAYRCKTLPDVESAGACWVTAEQLEHLPLRSALEPMTWIPWVANGGEVLPLDTVACPELLRVFPDYPL